MMRHLPLVKEALHALNGVVFAIGALLLVLGIVLGFIPSLLGMLGRWIIEYAQREFARIRAWRGAMP